MQDPTSLVGLARLSTEYIDLEPFTKNVKRFGGRAWWSGGLAMCERNQSEYVATPLQGSR